MALTPTLSPSLLKIHINLSTVREASVLSDITSSYFVHMQMKNYILCVSAPYVQAGAGT